MKVKLNNFIFVILWLVLSSCVLMQKKEPQFINNTPITNNEKIKISASSKSTFSSFYSANVDITEEKKITSPEVIKDFEASGFQIVDSNMADYEMICSFNSKTSTYVPKNGQPFYFILKYLWAYSTIFSLGLIPYYNQIDYSVSINVTNNLTKSTTTYELNLSYDVWVSLFLIHRTNEKNPYDSISEKNKTEFRRFLNNIKSEIKNKKT